jgi:single-strand DNA-binding protein
MPSINKVMLMGNLGRDPELRFTNNQKAVANFSIATKETFTSGGEKKETTEWHKIVVWGKQAESCAAYLQKGRAVFVEGKLQTRTWDKDGVKQYTTEIVADRVHFLASQKNASATEPAPNEAPEQLSADEIPF